MDDKIKSKNLYQPGYAVVLAEAKAISRHLNDETAILNFTQHLDKIMRHSMDPGKKVRAMNKKAFALELLELFTKRRN